MNHDDIPDDVSRRLRALLLWLARREDEQAAAEAAVTPHWAPCPASVAGHREAAAVLRVEADSLLAVNGGSAAHDATCS